MMDTFTSQTPCPYCGLVLQPEQYRCPQCWKPNPNALNPPGEEEEKNHVEEN